MKIVMLYDCAYVARELTTELVTHDIFVKSLSLSSGPFSTLRTARKLKKYDGLIHSHFVRSPAYASYLSGKKYILHAHGTDLRSGIGYFKRKALRKAELVLVSTKDLLDLWPGSRYLPNPVGPQFKPMNVLKPFKKDHKVYIAKWFEPFRALSLKDNLTVHIQTKKIPYEYMPGFLNQFETFIDQRTYPALSKTALEALSCGLTVINWKGEKIKGLPPQHKVKNVVCKLLEFYEMVNC